mgnify:CR=1 FL=1|tara:strand:+ start:122 stop:460 length:339 start_codon:yes stop_codon:yes gene_type:complete
MPPKKSPARRTPAKRSPVRNVVSEAEYAINEVDAEPSREIFSVMNYLSYLFVLFALAAGIAWIYYVAKANEDDVLDDTAGNVVNTASVCFQATVVSVLLYFVARHHFHHLHH